MKVVCMTVVKRGEELPGTVASFILEFHQALEQWSFLDPGPGLDLIVFHEVMPDTKTGLLSAKRFGWRGREFEIVFGFGTDFLAASPADQKAQYITFIQAALERLLQPQVERYRLMLDDLDEFIRKRDHRFREFFEIVALYRE